MLSPVSMTLQQLEYILAVNHDWVKVQYHRTKKGSFIKKETVTKLIDLSCISGFKVEGEL